MSEHSPVTRLNPAGWECRCGWNPPRTQAPPGDFSEWVAGLGTERAAVDGHATTTAALDEMMAESAQYYGNQPDDHQTGWDNRGRTMYAWAQCPQCSWSLWYFGMPLGWKPDPLEVESHLIAHQAERHLADV